MSYQAFNTHADEYDAWFDSEPGATIFAMEVQAFLGVHPVVDWSQVFYQYTNRLAHLYLLRELNDIHAFLVFLYFIGDHEMDGPLTLREWKSAIQVVKGILGLREAHKLSKYVVDLFIDISEMQKAVAERTQ